MRKFIITLVSIAVISAFTSCGNIEENSKTAVSLPNQSDSEISNSAENNSLSGTETTIVDKIEPDLSEQSSIESVTDESSDYLKSTDYPEDSWEYVILKYHEYLNTGNFTDAIYYTYPDKIFDMYRESDLLNDADMKQMYEESFSNESEYKIKKITVINTCTDWDYEFVNEELNSLYKSLPDEQSDTEKFSVDELLEVRMDYINNNEANHEYMYMAMTDNRWLIRYSPRKMYEEEFGNPEITGLTE